MSPHQQMHELGVFVHGLLAGLHLIGLGYNLQRRNWFDVAMHAAALVYDAHAVTTHLQEVRSA